MKAHSDAALMLLIDRLNWPVKMVRWRAAKAIKQLMEQEATRQTTTTALLRWVSNCRFESEVGSALSVLLVAPPETRPSFDVVCSHIQKPSLLSGLLLEKIYGWHCGNWGNAHSGYPSQGFVASQYFDDYKTAHVPRVFFSNLKLLERQSGLPFTLQWAHEWETVAKQTETCKTGYPSYFGDFGLQRSGVTGQFVQRQGEVYRSAYLRTLAFAVSAWRLPPQTAALYGMDTLLALPDLFDVEPQDRPKWLSDVPAQCLSEGADLSAIGRQIIEAGTTANDSLVSIGSPLPAEINEFADLTISAFLVTDDFHPSDDQKLRSANQIFFANSYRFNSVRENLEPKPIAGRSGHAIPVCSQVLPSPHGMWHDDYLQRGLLLPAPYCFDDVTAQRADANGLSLLLRSKTVAKASFWHDAWTPLNAPEGPTRCGIALTMRRNELEQAARRFGMQLGWFAHLSFMEKDSQFGDLLPRTRTAFFK